MATVLHLTYEMVEEELKRLGEDYTEQELHSMCRKLTDWRYTLWGILRSNKEYKGSRRTTGIQATPLWWWCSSSGSRLIVRMPVIPDGKCRVETCLSVLCLTPAIYS